MSEASDQAETYQRHANESFARADELTRQGKLSRAAVEQEEGERWQRLAEEVLRRN